MKRWSFRLERVARIRQIERDRAHGDWVRSMSQQRLIEQRIADLRDAARAEANGIAVGQIRTIEEVRAGAFRAGLRAQAAELAVTDLTAAEAATAQAAATLLQASRKVDVLAKLETRQREEWQVAADREQTLVADDLSSTRAAARAMRRQQVAS